MSLPTVLNRYFNALCDKFGVAYWADLRTGKGIDYSPMIDTWIETYALGFNSPDAMYLELKKLTFKKN